LFRQAIELSRKAGLDDGTHQRNLRSGDRKDGTLVSPGMNPVAASHETTWRGEMEALRLACIRLQSFRLPKEERSILLTQVLRKATVELWRAYQAGPGRVHF
jgi:tRNA(Arg) A34 adenosine deaminase TadA